MISIYTKFLKLEVELKFLILTEIFTHPRQSGPAKTMDPSKDADGSWALGMILGGRLKVFGGPFLFLVS